MDTPQVIAKCIRELRRDVKLRRVTAYVTARWTVKATRQHRAYRRRDTFVVTVGHPNYRERAWIKTLQRARVPFPQRRLRFDRWPARARNKRRAA